MWLGEKTKIKFEKRISQTFRSLVFSGAAVLRRKKGEKLLDILVSLVSRHLAIHVPPGLIMSVGRHTPDKKAPIVAKYVTSTEKELSVINFWFFTDSSITIVMGPSLTFAPPV